MMKSKFVVWTNFEGVSINPIYTIFQKVQRILTFKTLFFFKIHFFYTEKDGENKI